MVGVRYTMTCVRHVGLPRSPNARANPGESCQDQVDDGAQREDLRCAVAVGQSAETYAQAAIRERENAPGDQARDQQIDGRAQKSENRYGGQKTKDRSSDEIALK